MARRRRGGSGGGGHESSERWLLTYADMITLLLALFILLFSMSTVSIVKFDAVKRSLSRTFKGQVFMADKAVIDGSQSVLDPSAPAQDPSNSIEIQDATQKLNASFASQAKAVKKLAAKDKLSGAKGVTVTTTERGVVVRLSGDALFASGSAELNPTFTPFLASLATQFRVDPEQHPLSIEGHTDGQPIHGGGIYASNWSLSSARALSVLDFLLQHKVPAGRMRATFYSSTRPVVLPAYPEQSVKENRRVEIVLLAPGGDARATAGGSGSPASDAIPAAAPAPVAHDSASIAPISKDHPVVDPIVKVSIGAGK